MEPCAAVNGIPIALRTWLGSNEPDVQAEPARLTRLFKPLAGLAVAASVAVVAVFSLQSVRQESPAGASAVATAPVSNEFAAVDTTPLLANTGSGAQSLDVYLVNHNEYAVNRGMLPYVRLVGHDMHVDDKE